MAEHGRTYNHIKKKKTFDHISCVRVGRGSDAKINRGRRV